MENGQNKLAELKGLLTAGLPDLGPGPRGGVMTQGKLDEVLDEVLQDGGLPRISQELVRGLILLWHDHMEPAHEIAQAIESSDGSFLHGIIHRREPDYGNAAYWFRRVGRHKCFPEIAHRAAELLKAQNAATTRGQLIRDAEWDAFGFISACEKAAVKNPSDASVKLLQEIQRIESEVLLEAWATG